MNRRDFLSSLGRLFGGIVLGSKIKIDIAEEVITETIKLPSSEREIIKTGGDKWFSSGSAFCVMLPLWMQQEYLDDTPIRYDELYGESD